MEFPAVGGPRVPSDPPLDPPLLSAFDVPSISYMIPYTDVHIHNGDRWCGANNAIAPGLSNLRGPNQWLAHLKRRTID